MVCCEGVCVGPGEKGMGERSEDAAEIHMIIQIRAVLTQSILSVRSNISTRNVFNQVLTMSQNLLIKTISILYLLFTSGLSFFHVDDHGFVFSVFIRYTF